MIRVQTLHESALVAIERIDHPDRMDHHDPDAEVSKPHSINLLERGAR